MVCSTLPKKERSPKYLIVQIGSDASLQYNLMKFFENHFKKLTLLSVAGYLFIFAIAAKGVYFYGSQHPSKEELIVVYGIVKKMRLGGNGKSTSFQIKSHNGTHVYSSYYGVVWPGMELIRLHDQVHVLAERNKLNKNELITGKRYYIWELIHREKVIFSYDDIRELVNGKEESFNRYLNGILAVSALFLLIAYIRKLNFK